MANDKQGKGGWVKLWRKYLQHEFWTEKRRFSKAEAWLDLVMLAEYEAEHSGQVDWDLRHLAVRWSWPWSTTQRFLAQLQQKQMVSLWKNCGRTRILLLSYGTYQGPASSDSESGYRETKEVAKHEANQPVEVCESERTPIPELVQGTCDPSASSSALPDKVDALERTRIPEQPQSVEHASSPRTPIPESLQGTCEPLASSDASRDQNALFFPKKILKNNTKTVCAREAQPDPAPRPDPTPPQKRRSRKREDNPAPRWQHPIHNRFVWLFATEYEALVAEHGAPLVDKAAEVVDLYCRAQGKTYKDYAAVFTGWGLRRARQELRGDEYQSQSRRTQEARDVWAENLRERERLLELEKSGQLN